MITRLVGGEWTRFEPVRTARTDLGRYFARAMLTAAKQRDEKGRSMAQLFQTTYIDDIDGTDLGENANTLSFAFEGKEYSIDLSDANADISRQAIAPYISAGRRVTTAFPPASHCTLVNAGSAGPFPPLSTIPIRARNHRRPRAGKGPPYVVAPAWHRFLPATLAPAAWLPESYGCACCHQPDLPLEPHEPVDDPDDLGLLFVCQQCHDRLHTPLPPDPAGLIYADRPLCPSCSASRTDDVITCMPPTPSPVGYYIAGCTILGLPDDFMCQAFGVFWAEDDRYFPRASAPGPEVRVRARIVNQPGSPDRADFAPYETGRLVFGRPAKNAPPPCLVAAWGSLEHVVLIGDDRRVYNVDPATVRHLDPDPEKVPFMNPTRVVTQAANELFSRLERPTGDVTLCAPFLTSEIAARLADLARDSEVDWYLLTHLDAQAAANGYQSVDGLRALLDAGVHMVNYPKLHAKAYVIGHDFALVGSANLTAAGLGIDTAANAELSIIVPESDVEAVQQILDRWWGHGEDIDAARLDRLDELARRIPRFSPAAPSTTATVSALLDDAERDDVTLWIKAHYGPARPDTWNREAWFSTSGSTGTPSFKPGDLVAIYSQDDHSCYCIVQVIDEPRYNPGFVAEFEGADNADRWPWVNTTAPRLIPADQTGISLHELGVKAQGLQGGRRRLTLDQFRNIVNALNASPDDRTESDEEIDVRDSTDASRRVLADELEEPVPPEPLPFEPPEYHGAYDTNTGPGSDALRQAALGGDSSRRR